MHLDDVLTELVEHSGDRLLRVAYQLTHDAAAAQDLVQAALLRVYQSVRHRGLAPEDWYAYLRRAVVNEYVRTRRLRSSSEIVTDVVPERPAAGGLEDRAADQAELWAALGALSERQRAVFASSGIVGPAVRQAFASGRWPPAHRWLATGHTRTSAGSARTPRWFPRARRPPPSAHPMPAR
ncbi:MAG TPA: sigma factor [Streptosporangiaceae bacterium]